MPSTGRSQHGNGREGVRADYLPSVDDIVRTVVDEARPGDVLLVMSNGGFGGIHEKLLTALAGTPD